MDLMEGMCFTGFGCEAVCSGENHFNVASGFRDATGFCPSLHPLPPHERINKLTFRQKVSPFATGKSGVITSISSRDGTKICIADCHYTINESM